jgi:hypothetical protein
MATKFKKTICEVHKYHSPRPQRVDVHHVWPSAMGGPDVQENVIGACQTGHTNIHMLIDTYIKNKGIVPWTTLRSYGPSERKYAKLGYDRITKKSL